MLASNVPVPVDPEKIPVDAAGAIAYDELIVAILRALLQAKPDVAKTRLPSRAASYIAICPLNGKQSSLPPVSVASLRSRLSSMSKYARYRLGSDPPPSTLPVASTH